MITPTSWSRSEWLRRLGFKTGDMPPIAAAFTPTLASGDASELLPPLLAPQGWAGGEGTVTANFSAWELQSRGIGGTFVCLEVGRDHLLHFSPTPVVGFTASTTKAVQEVVPGVTSVLRDGNVAVYIAASDPYFREGFGSIYLTPIYIPPGTYLYAYAAANAISCPAAFLIRDVPAGNAGD